MTGHPWAKPVTPADDVALAEMLREELAEMDKLATWRTQQALDEFEDAWREWDNGTRRIMPANRRSIYVPLSADHPAARRDPWPAELLDKSTWREVRRG